MVKLRIIALLEHIFHLGKDERSVSYTTIQKVCHIDHDYVDTLITKAMALNLIRGTIDEVRQVVHVDWILPRYLN